MADPVPETQIPTPEPNPEPSQPNTDSPRVTQPGPTPLVGVTPAFAASPQGRNIPAFLAGTVKSPWLCPRGHILGFVLHEKRDGRVFTRLALFPFSFIPTEYIPANLTVSRIDAGDITCTRCGAVRPWLPSEWLMQGFLAKRERRKHKE